MYDERADEYMNRYERVNSETIHADWLSLLPSTKLLILDIGAGSGRDAAWFAEQGHEVVAVEPSDEMRTRAENLHPHPAIQWINDRLPALDKIHALDYRFDIILLSAVWMHVAPSHRERAFRKLAEILKPGGLLIFTSRDPLPDDGRTMYPVDPAQLRHRAHQRALEVVQITESDDQLRRTGVTWTTVVLRLPDDGTGALPLIRHILINDDTSATYKPALLRAILRVANGAQGAVLESTSEYVAIPIGLVALYWLRMYRWLMIDHDYRQLPGTATPGFDTEHFRALENISDYDLRIGRLLSGDPAQHVIESIRKVRDTIRSGPAHYITYPGTNDTVFKYIGGHLRSASTVRLNMDFFHSVGELRVPRHVWEALSHHACWIEPVIVNRWAELMEQYDGTSSRNAYVDALRWPIVERATGMVRARITELQQQNTPVYCVWSGQRLNHSYDVDHCFPFSYWPNNDLWNLLPTASAVNSAKSNKLPSAEQIQRSKDRLLTWWRQAYDQSPYNTQFFEEAHTALPINAHSTYGDVINGLHVQRMRLKIDQQIAEWEYER